jgi:endo-1,4-beta-xylanase
MVIGACGAYGNDRQSWLDDFPWKRVNYPLLFDHQEQPKAAYHSVLKVPK